MTITATSGRVTVTRSIPVDRLPSEQYERELRDTQRRAEQLDVTVPSQRRGRTARRTRRSKKVGRR